VDVDDVSTDDGNERRDPNATGEKAAICWQAAKRRHDFHMAVMIITAM
jgi:hypothetical protein